MYYIKNLLGTCGFALFLTGCEEVTFPVPAQQPTVAHRARTRLEMALDAPEPGGAAIESGVDPVAPNVDWRWMSSDAVFGFDLEDRPDWQLELHLTAVDKVLQEVGPQEVVVLVNGTEAGRVALNKPGPLHLAYAVHAGPKTTVELRTTPCLTPPKAPSYCALVHSVGFSRELK